MIYEPPPDLETDLDGFQLPLALNYAGTVIREKLCEWKDYLTYYKTKQSEYAKNTEP